MLPFDQYLASVNDHIKSLTSTASSVTIVPGTTLAWTSSTARMSLAVTSSQLSSCRSSFSRKWTTFEGLLSDLDRWTGESLTGKEDEGREAGPRRMDPVRLLEALER